MSRPPPIGGLARHFLLTLRLNFRSPQPLIYGYLVPLLFLLAFGAVFRGETPVLRAQMGQLITISILGGACFGLPTALVAERERGLWKLYSLLPLHPAWLLLSTLCVRLLLIASTVLLQILVAHALYGTPWPENLPVFLGGFLLTCGAFLGLGLVIAALARSVPAVQAIGQCLFLPMLMIGGVGIPLAALPEWAGVVSGFMPGRYAVALLNAGYTDGLGLLPVGFNSLALAAIGLCAGAVGLALFQASPTEKRGRRAALGALAALVAWLGVGGVASYTGRLDADALVTEGLQDITPEILARISYDDLPDDGSFVTRLAPPFPAGRLPPGLESLAARLESWEPAREGPPVQRIRTLLSAASLADVSRAPQEAELARLVFNKLIREHRPGDLRRALAWIILRPSEGTVPASAPALGLERSIDEAVVRERNTYYAKKLLGRQLGKLQAP